MSRGPITLRWSCEAVEAEAIQRASYVLSRTCTTEVVQVGTEWVVTVHPRNGAADDQVAHRFRQEVVDQSLRISIAARTEPLRNAVFAMAFSRLPAGGSPDR